MCAAIAPDAGNWTAMVPFFSKADGIAETLVSLARQTLAPSRLVFP